MEIPVSRYVREMIGIFTRVSCEQSLGRGLALMSFIVHHLLTLKVVFQIRVKCSEIT